MTASSSNDDLADLLGNLADADQGIDEETLASIDHPDTAGKTDDAGATEDDALAAVAAEAEHAGDQSEDTEAVAAVPAMDSAPEPAAAEAEEAEEVPEAMADDEPVAEAEIDTESGIDGAVHEEELQEGADALAAAADGETVAEESEDMEQFAAATQSAATGAAVGASSKAAAPHRRHGRHAIKSDAMKTTMAPILLTVGLILLVPAIWGTLLLMGVDTFMSDRSNASTMAKFMLMCWPIAIALIVTAIILLLQVAKAKKKAEAREARSGR